MRLLKIAGLMAAQYALVVANTRAIAAGSYAGTIASDVLIAANGLVLTKFAVNAETRAEKAAYIAGGSVGSALALYLTSGWL